MKKSVGRPRKANKVKKEQISINLPRVLIDKLNNHLSYSQSRSRYVESAIRTVLESKYDRSLIPSEHLAGMLYAREIIDEELFRLLMKRVEETASKQ
jgi:metal-responsive CopG/Arc/MetJ family transcriptional regulator